MYGDNLRFERSLGLMLVINLLHFLITEERDKVGLKVSVHRPFSVCVRTNSSLVSRSGLVLCLSAPLNGIVVHGRLALPLRIFAL